MKVNSLQAGGTAENILLVGSTSRCALKVQNPAYGLCSQGVNGVNSDIDMILHLVPSTGSVSLLSIPRDLFVPNARVIGANKIDAALYEGPSQLVKAIEEDFAIPINHYVVLNFDTFASVVNALGGVKMYFPCRSSTPSRGSISSGRAATRSTATTPSKSCGRVTSRSSPIPRTTTRATWPFEALSDIARIRRTHEFFRVLAAKVAARGLGNPLTDQRIATSVLPDLTVDSGLSEGEMVSLARNFAHTSIAVVPQYTYPVTNVETGSLLYQGYYYGDVVFPVEPDGLTSIERIFDVAPGDNTFTGEALPAPSKVTVSVENATGAASETAAIATPLRAKGFASSRPATSPPRGPSANRSSGTAGRRRRRRATGSARHSPPPSRCSTSSRDPRSSATTPRH